MRLLYKLCIVASMLVFMGTTVYAQNTCATAVSITAEDGCTSVGYDNTGMTSEASDPSPSCWDTAPDNSYWLTFTATAGQVTINTNFTTNGGSITNTQVALFEGTCGALTELGCNEDIIPGSNDMAALTYYGLTIGETYYIMVDGDDSQTGEFNLCVENIADPSPPEAGKDCDSGAPLCDTADFSATNVSDGEGSPEAPSCFSFGEGNSVWVYFTASTTDPLEFTIAPTVDDDYDYALYDLGPAPGDCGTKTELACNYATPCNGGGPTSLNYNVGMSSNPAGMDCPAGYDNAITPVVGNVYAILVSNFSGTDGFTLSFDGATEFAGPQASFDHTSLVGCGNHTVDFTNTSSVINDTDYSWDFGDGSPVTSVNDPSYTYTAPGTYTVTLTAIDNVYGCIATATAEVTIEPGPAAGFNYTSPCVGEQVDFTNTTTDGSTYTWDFDNDGNPDATTTDASYTFPGSGPYDVTLIADNGLGCLDTVVVSVALSPTPVAPTAGTDASYCDGETIADMTATAGSGGTLTWYTDSGLTTSIGTGTTMSPTVTTAGSTTTYYVTETLNGCESPASTVTITINATPAAPTAGTDASYCDGETIADMTATAGSGGTLTWYTDSGLTTSIGTGTTMSPTVTTAGSTTTYYVTETVGACESAASTVTITINNTPAAPTAGTDATYCDGETIADMTATAGSGGTLTWYTDSGLTTSIGTGTTMSPTVTTAGSTTTYYVTETLGACESAASTVTITINPTPAAPTAGTDATYCDGDVIADMTATAGSGGTLTWYTDSGLTTSIGTGTAMTPTVTTVGSTTTYYVTETLGACESAASTVTISIIAPPSAPTAGTDATYCDGETIANMTVTGSGGTYTWYTDSGLTTSIGTGSTMAPSVTTAGTVTTYYVTETAGSCVSPASTVTITINATPAAPTAGTDATYCDGDVIADMTATAGSGGTLTWYTDSGLTTSIGTGATMSPSVTTAGTVTTYYVTETLNNCESTASTVTITINATPAAPTAGTDATYCDGDVIADMTATGSLGSTLTWYTDSGLTTSIGTGGSMTPTVTTVGSTTTYYVTETLNGCEGPASTVTIVINTAPTAPTAGTDATYCDGDVIADMTATDGSGGTLTWYTDSGLTTSIGTGATMTPSVTTAGTTTTYYVTETLGSCVSPASTVTITINATPVAPTAGTDATYCDGDVIADMTATDGSGGTLTWYTDAGLTTSIGTGTTMAPTETAAGTTTTYYVTETLNGCEGPASMVTISIGSLPVITVSQDVQIAIGETASISVTIDDPNSTVSWDPTDNMDDPNSLSPNVTPNETTTYTVTVTSPEGCVTTAEVTVFVDAQVIIPNIITPNADGFNDTFEMTGLGSKSWSLVVYNRWGDIVYQTNDYQNFWNAQKHGDGPQVSDGSYYYLLQNNDDKSESYKGWVAVQTSL